MSIVEKTQAVISIIEQYQLESVIRAEVGNFTEIHLMDPKEMDKFGAVVKAINRNSVDYPTELSAEINGVRVFALVRFEVGAA